MVEEDPLLERAGVELAVLAEEKSRLGEAVGLAGGVEAEDVRLGFVHPETNQLMTWEAKPPADFAKVWAELRKCGPVTP